MAHEQGTRMKSLCSSRCYN